jgi:spore coat protein A
MTASYHDHALGISRLNNYAGLNGFYIIESPQEEQLDLPSGEYDIPLMLQDRTFEADGSLHYPDSFVPNFAGDTAFVNGAVWPYMEVEPRQYRFRLLNQSNGRTFDLALASDHGDGHDGHEPDVPFMYQFAPDQGFLENAVAVGPGGDLESLTLAPFERAEVVVDFSGYAGETFTVTTMPSSRSPAGKTRTMGTAETTMTRKCPAPTSEKSCSSASPTRTTRSPTRAHTRGRSTSRPNRVTTRRRQRRRGT